MGDFNTICRNIKELKIQGAENIAKVGVKALLIKHDKNSVKKLLNQRPTEPLLKNSVSYVLRQKDIKQGVKAALAHMETATEDITKLGAPLIHGKIFTHCHSSTVINILKKAKKQGNHFEVFNTETRPKFQGRKTAVELSEANIKVTNVVDLAAEIFIKKSDLFIIGADAITKDGVINKIGSGMLSEIAHNHKVNVYIAADSWKFSNKNVKIEERNFNEVWKNAPKNIQIKNPAFEMIDKKYITAVISELGILKFDDFIREINKPKKTRKVVALDMDETIIHSNNTHIRALNDAFVNNGLKALSYSKVKDALTGQSTHQIVKKLFPRLDKKTINNISKDHHKFVFKYIKYTTPIRGAVETLTQIKRKYDLALLSNCTHKEVLALLKGAKINKDLFDIIIGKDQVKRSKPYPDELLRANEILHRNVEYMIGDSIYDVIAGKKFKIKTISVLTGNTPLSLIKKHKPDYIVDSIADVDEIVT